MDGHSRLAIAISYVALLSTLGCGSAKPEGVRNTIGEQSPPSLRLDDRTEPISYRVNLTLDPNSEDFSGNVDISTVIKRPIRTIWLN